MPKRGKEDVGSVLLFCGLGLLVLGLVLVVVGGIAQVLTARFVAEAKPAVTEVVSSCDYRGRYGDDRCCVTTVVVVDADGSRLTGGWRDPVRYIPGGSVNVLYRRGPSYRPVRIVPDDEWAVLGSARVSLKAGGTFAAIGIAGVLTGILLRRRSRASA